MNWRRFFNRKQIDEEQQQELESYVEITAEEYIARGMNPEAARADGLAADRFQPLHAGTTIVLSQALCARLGSDCPSGTKSIRPFPADQIRLCRIW